MRYRVYFLIYILIWFVASACGNTPPPATPEPSPPLPSATPSDSISKVRVGIFPDSPPFEFKKDGNLNGFDIDLMNAIAGEAGFEIEFVETRNWGAIFRDLANGKFDAVISSATITDERKQLVDFSDPYFNAGQVIVIKEGSAITGPADLNGRTVGVLQGSTGETWLLSNTTSLPSTYDNAGVLFESVINNQVEAAIYDNAVVLQYIKDNPGAGLIKLDSLLTDELYAIAVSKDQPQLLGAINQALKVMQESDVYDQIYAQWFTGNPPTLPTPSNEQPAPETPSSTVAGGVTIQIVYGSEKQAWLEPLIQLYNQAGRTTPQGVTIAVEATAMGSIESVEEILAGKLQATVWSPASSLYVPLAQAEWQQRYSTDMMMNEPRSLVRSPVVIAMWEPMAQALGWPDTPLGWNAIHSLSGKSWAEYGHPEWGEFKFGHTHPEHSNSGLSALLAEAYAGAGKQNDLTREDLERPEVRQFIAQIEDSIIDYGRTTGFFSNRMFDCTIGGPDYLSAAALYENLVVQERNCPNDPRVVAIYPSEGTFWSDHPYVILNAPWVSDEQKAAAEDFATFLLDTPQQQRALESGFRPADTTIPLSAPLTVENGVNPDEPSVLLGIPSAEVIKYAQQVWRESKKVADIVVVMDTSGSMVEDDKIGQAKDALSNFVNLLSDQDRLKIITFSRSIDTLTELSPLGEKRTQVQEQIAGIQPEGPTPLYDAVIGAYNDLKANGDPNRIRAIVVLTDGRDERIGDNNEILPGSTSTQEQMLEAIQIGAEGGNAIKLFTIAYGAGADSEVLQRMAQTTGGEQFDAGTETIRLVYEQIAIFF